MNIPTIVVLGAGYAGLMTVTRLQKELHDQEARIILVNKHDYQYITTKLHEPAAGNIPDEAVQIRIAPLLDRRKVKFKQDTVKAIHPAQKQVQLTGEKINYDYLVVALGGEPECYGIPGLKEHAYYIWSLNTIRKLRNHIEDMFEAYRLDQDESRLTFVVGGAGFTGIEFLCELEDRIPELCREYGIPRDKVRVVCVEAASEVLKGYDSEISEYARNCMVQKGAELLLETPVSKCEADGVVLADGTKIKSSTIVWTGGIRGSSILEQAGFETLNGRALVDEQLEIPDWPGVFVLGDSGIFFNAQGRPLPPTAQVAIQQGPVCAQNIVARIRGGQLAVFKPNFRGMIMSLGHHNAAGVVFRRRIRGRIAALLKKVIELRYYFKLGGIRMLVTKMLGKV